MGFEIGSLIYTFISLISKYKDNPLFLPPLSKKAVDRYKLEPHTYSLLILSGEQSKKVVH